MNYSPSSNIFFRISNLFTKTYCEKFNTIFIKTNLV